MTAHRGRKYYPIHETARSQWIVGGSRDVGVEKSGFRYLFIRSPLSIERGINLLSSIYLNFLTG